MRHQPLWFALIGALALGSDAAMLAQPRESVNRFELTGRIVELHSPRLFSVRELEPGGREIFVLAPRALSPDMKDATVRIEGTLRRLTDAELKQTVMSDTVGEQLRLRLSGRTVLVARSVIAAREGGAASQEVSPAAEDPSRIETRGRQPAVPATAAAPLPPLTIRASMLVAGLEGLAGQPVRILGARVVGLLEPRAFLIEPATEYLKDLGTRDRIVVFVQDGELRVPADLLVGQTVIVEGIARTVLGMQVSQEVPWPERLERDRVKRLEVRAAMLATSVRTAEGTELTNRR